MVLKDKTNEGIDITPMGLKVPVDTIKDFLNGLPSEQKKEFLDSVVPIFFGSPKLHPERTMPLLDKLACGELPNEAVDVFGIGSLKKVFDFANRLGNKKDLFWSSIVPELVKATGGVKERLMEVFSEIEQK